MQDYLQVEVCDGGAGRAHVVACRDRSCSTIDERTVHRPEPLQDEDALAVETRRRGRREDRIAFEFDDGEIGLHTVDHGVEESPEHRVGCWDAPAEIEPVCNLDAGHEARVARDVGEQQVPLACRRICLGR
jgi:hypothetical protein